LDLIHNFVCPICNYAFFRYTKYIGHVESWVWKYCSYKCYYQSSDYFTDRQDQVKEIIEKIWWNPDS